MNYGMGAHSPTSHAPLAPSYPPSRPSHFPQVRSQQSLRSRHLAGLFAVAVALRVYRRGWRAALGLLVCCVIFGVLFVAGGVTRRLLAFNNKSEETQKLRREVRDAHADLSRHKFPFDRFPISNPPDIAISPTISCDENSDRKTL